VSDNRQQFRLLTRHFFRGFLDNDLISPSSDLHGLLAKVAALLVIPGLMYPFRLLFTYGRPFREYRQLDLLSWADKSTFVTLSLVVMGLLTALEWDALNLDRRDSLALGALPIRSRTILWAKLAALGTFVLVLSVPLTALGALTFPIVMHAGWSSGVSALLLTIVGHAVATLAAASFAFFGLLALHGVMHAALGQRALRRLSAAVQLVTTLVLVVTLLMLPFIASRTAALKHASEGAAGFAPQMWFVGIYQTVSGQGDDEWRLLASRGWIALAATVVVALVASIVSYRRVLGTTLEAVQAGSSRQSWIGGAVDLAARVIVRNQVERGFFSFTVHTLVRSPWHRVVLAAFLGGALALAVVTLDFATVASDGVGTTPMVVSHALAMQFVVLVLVLAGVRAAAAAPAELRANWTLRLLDTGQPRRWMGGFRKAVLFAIVGPVVTAMAGAVWLQYGWHTAWTYALADLVFAVLTFDVLFLGFGRAPFACAFDGASGEAKLRWYVLASLFTIVVVSVAQLVTLLLGSFRGSVSLAVVCLGVIAWLRWWGNRALSARGGLSFEHQEPGTQALGLGA
jgi:hypothetical protein